MNKLALTLACGRYDRTRALEDGRVAPNGVDLNYIALEPFELFWRQARYGEFDASEYSLGAYLIERARGNDRFTAIPVFPSRAFRHSCVYVNARSGIKRPEDLKGKRIGVPDFTLTALIWLRGMLADDHGIGNEDAIWYTGGLNKPGGEARVAVDLPPAMEVHHETARSLDALLAANELDALLAPLPPKSFADRSSQVVRLWDDFAQVEEQYHARTGFFPMMHAIVVKKELHAANPWLARNLMQAFEAAKAAAQDELHGLSVLKTMLPWQFAAYERTTALMGEDYWPYGMERNRAEFDTLARYAHEQGLTPRRVQMDEVFAESTQG